MKKRNLGKMSNIRLTYGPEGGYKHAVSDCNAYISDILPHFSSVPFDSRIGNLDVQTCANSLIVSRIVKKFVPNGGTTVDLKSAAIMGFSQYERDLRMRMSKYSIGDHPYLLKVRRKLIEMCKGFRIDFTDCELDVGPGETYLSSGGMTHIIAKLSDLNHWTTTSECLQSTCMLIYHNRALKRLAKEHIGHVPKELRTELYVRHKDHPATGYAVFSDLLERIITVVPGSRGSSVPKNNETDRFINIEPFFPMLLQRLVAKALLRCLKASGYALDGNFPKGFSAFTGDRQLLHKRMIANSSYATIDFSNASDSVCWNVIQSLFPQKVVTLLGEFRSVRVMLKADDYTYGCELFKLSSMGNGFTFEVMTLLLLAAARCYTDDCSVFGDDVIIPNNYAKEFIQLTDVLGFRANNKKTFIGAKFRESCGSFYHDDYGYLISFDMRRLETYNDIIIMHNKIAITLLHNSELLSEQNKSLLQKVREKLASKAPLCRKGPLPPSINSCLENLGNYFYDEGDIRRKHMKSETIRNQYHKWIDKLTLLFASLQLDPKDWILVVGSAYKAQRNLNQNRTTLACNLIRLLTLRPVIETVRGEGKWHEPLLLVEVTTGRTIRVSNLLLDQRKVSPPKRVRSYPTVGKDERNGSD